MNIENFLIHAMVVDKEGDATEQSKMMMSDISSKRETTWGEWVHLNLHTINPTRENIQVKFRYV